MAPSLWTQPGIGWLRLERLEAMFGSLELAWQASEADLRHALGGSTQLRQREEASLAAYRRAEAAGELIASSYEQALKQETGPAEPEQLARFAQDITGRRLAVADEDEQWWRE